MFEALLGIGSFVAAGIASIAGFGIGSILTPLFSLKMETRTAVAAVSIPHFIATALRLWFVRKHIDKHVLYNFGVFSAIGGLAGALLNATASNPILTFIFASLLIFAGLSDLTGLASKMRFGSKIAWAAGALSGILGGLVGNQGGIRSAALLGFNLNRQAYIATATATGVIVDAARMPVYFVAHRADLYPIANLILISSVAAILGTIAGTLILHKLPERVFRLSVDVLLVGLGLYMMRRAVAGG